jgi:hypothetical protein
MSACHALAVAPQDFLASARGVSVSAPIDTDIPTAATSAININADPRAPFDSLPVTARTAHIDINVGASRLRSALFAAPSADIDIHVTAVPLPTARSFVARAQFRPSAASVLRRATITPCVLRGSALAAPISVPATADLAALTRSLILAALHLVHQAAETRGVSAWRERRRCVRTDTEGQY